MEYDEVLSAIFNNTNKHFIAGQEKQKQRPLYIGGGLMILDIFYFYIIYKMMIRPFKYINRFGLFKYNMI